MTLTMLDVFAGIGGVSLAGDAAGFATVGFVEKDPFCQRVLQKHWPEVPLHSDIETFTADVVRGWGLGHIDLAHFSPPCQSLSIAGKRKAHADARYLWGDALRIISEVRPTCVLVENVAGAIRLALDDWLTDLERAGYAAWSVVLPASAVGAPHRRERLFVVAYTCGDESERRRGNGDVACAAGGSEGAGEERERHGDATCDCGSTLADTSGARRPSGPCRPDAAGERRGQCQSLGCRCTDDVAVGHIVCMEGAQRELRPQDSPGSIGGGRTREDVADAKISECERRGDSWERWSGSPDHRSGYRDADEGCDSEIKPGMGRDFARISPGLDRIVAGHHWPAPPGQPQYDWEPPRTVEGAPPNRRNRLKALGNAVVPAQCYPLLVAIRETLLTREAVG